VPPAAWPSHRVDSEHDRGCGRKADAALRIVWLIRAKAPGALLGSAGSVGAGSTWRPGAPLGAAGGGDSRRRSAPSPADFGSFAARWAG
jgi:hypothetical protein